MNNKNRFRKALSIALAVVCLLIFPAAALAADISVTADSTSVKAGDTVTVTVAVSGSHIAVADGVFTYDPAILSYISSNGGASDGYINMVSMQSGGGSSLTAIIKFAAIGAGEAVIDVSMENVLDYDGNSLGDAKAGVSITVASSGTDNGTDPGGATPTPVDISLTGVAAENVLGTDAQMYIWRSLRNISLPNGFTDRQVSYKGEYVGGAAIPDNEDIILLYLSEASGENAGYYIYNEQKNLMFPYLTLTSISAYFTFIWPDEQTAVPEGFIETMLELDDKNVPAWTAQGLGEDVFLVYVRSASGEIGFYLYNVTDRSLQRYKTVSLTEPSQTPQSTTAPAQTPAAAQQSEEEPEPQAGISVLTLVLAAVCLLLAAATVVFVMLYSKSAAKLKKQEKKGLRVKDADI